MKPTRIDYCQFRLSSQVNFTLRHYAEHHAHFSHDAINRYLRGEKLTSRLIWENVRSQIVFSAHGCLVFDDTVLDKDFSDKIELVKRQYSGNAYGVIKGIGVVNCLYVNPETGEYWITDYRIFDAAGDGKTKLDHVRDMLTQATSDKHLPFLTVLMDTWYATKDLMLFIEFLGKRYCCPLRDNRLVDDSAGERDYQHVDSLQWSLRELAHGKTIRLVSEACLAVNYTL